MKTKVTKRSAASNHAASDVPVDRNLAAVSMPIFDAHHTVKKQPGRGYRDEEDEALTVWVTALWKELHSRDETPVPPCPRCKNARTTRR
ncbi:hypothetical protein GR157_33285 [Burkholderia sp. 4701]|nr:hypothetical protein [Burkholderia sp. 4701]MXN86946.1 hypothetical protein [Burkholderia sp. 4812]